MATADLIERIIEREGGFVDHPADRGGPTKWGITLKTLEVFRGKVVTRADVEALSRTEAAQIYRRLYVDGPHFDAIADPQLQEQVVDAGVNHGQRLATQWLQAAADVKPDGFLGPITAAAVNAADPMELFLWMLAFRLRLYGRLVSQDPQLKAARAAGFQSLQAVMAAGWNNRIADFLERAANTIETSHKEMQP